MKVDGANHRRRRRIYFQFKFTSSAGEHYKVMNTEWVRRMGSWVETWEWLKFTSSPTTMMMGQLLSYSSTFGLPCTSICITATLLSLQNQHFSKNLSFSSGIHTNPRSYAGSGLFSVAFLLSGLVWIINEVCSHQHRHIPSFAYQKSPQNIWRQLGKYCTIMAFECSQPTD